jgi:hypothetical protein
MILEDREGEKITTTKCIFEAAIFYFQRRASHAASCMSRVTWRMCGGKRMRHRRRGGGDQALQKMNWKLSILHTLEECIVRGI